MAHTQTHTHTHSLSLALSLALNLPRLTGGRRTRTHLMFLSGIIHLTAMTASGSDCARDAHLVHGRSGPDCSQQARQNIRFSMALRQRQRQREKERERERE
jgi:hypothetical protein